MVDAGTLLLMLELFPGTLALVALGMLRSLPKNVSGLGHIALAFVFLDASSLAIRLQLTRDLVGAAASNGLFIAAMVLIPVGIGRLILAPHRIRSWLAVAAASWSLYIVFFLLEYRDAGRIVITSLTIWACLSALWYFSRKQVAVGWHSQLATALGLSLLVVGSVVRLRTLLADPVQSSLIQRDNTMLALYLLSLSIGLLLLGVGALLLAAERVRLLLDHQATHDPLTGVYSRRGFLFHASRLLEIVKRRPQPLSVIMLDVDHFKRINDQFGHDAGDRVLCHVAGTLEKALRPSDIFGRLGGEEFAILLPDTGLATAADIAERLRQGLHQSRCRFGELDIGLSASFGVAEYGIQGEDIEQWLNHADVAMYRAKHEGRNRVCCAGTAATASTALTSPALALHGQ